MTTTYINDTRPIGSSQNEAILKSVSRMLRKGKRTFGSTGASLTQQMWNPIFKNKGIDSALAAVGLEGEKATYKIISKWAEKHDNVVIVESAHIRGAGQEEVDEETGAIEGGDTDHIMIFGDMVLFIDSKNWKGKRKYSVSDKGEILRSGKPFPGGRVHPMQSMHLWATFLAPHRPTLNSFITITSDEVFVLRDRNWWKQPFKIFAQEDLESFLDKVWDSLSEENKSIIDVSLVADIASTIIKPYDVHKEMLGNLADLLNP